MCRCVQLVLCHICFLSVTQRNLDVSMYHRTMGVGEHILVRSVRISRGEKRQIYQGAQRGGHIEPQGIGGESHGCFVRCVCGRFGWVIVGILLHEITTCCAAYFPGVDVTIMISFAREVDFEWQDSCTWWYMRAGDPLDGSVCFQLRDFRIVGNSP